MTKRETEGLLEYIYKTPYCVKPCDWDFFIGYIEETLRMIGVDPYKDDDTLKDLDQLGNEISCALGKLRDVYSVYDDSRALVRVVKGFVNRYKDLSVWDDLFGVLNQKENSCKENKHD